MVFCGNLVRHYFPNEVFGAKVVNVMGTAFKEGPIAPLWTRYPPSPEVLSSQLRQLTWD